MNICEQTVKSVARRKGAHPFPGASSRRGLRQIQLAYKPCWPGGWLKETASAFKRLQPLYFLNAVAKTIASTHDASSRRYVGTTVFSLFV